MVMKLKFWVLCCLVACGASLWAKSESKSKLPDSYAFTRGLEEFNAEKYVEALDWFEREVSEHPDNGYAYVYVCLLRVANQEYGRALSAIDNALKRLPKKDKDWRSQAFASRADVYTSLGDTVRAYEDLSRAIQTDPSNPDFYESRAQLYFEQARYDLSDADYQKITDLDRGSVMGYMGVGRNAIAQERWDAGVSQLDYVIKLAPDYSSGYAFRAKAYVGQKKWAEAVDDIIRALDIDGDEMAFYLMQSLPAEATDLLKTKLKIQMNKQSTNRFWPYCLAMLAYNNNDYDESISYYEKAHALDANSLFLENIATCYMDKGDYARALDYAERAQAMSPDDYDLVNLKANILSRYGRFDECLVERDRYLEKFPDSSIAYYQRAEDRMNARRYNEAVDDYNTAVVLAPFLGEYSFVIAKRGDAYRLSGKKEAADKDYELVLKMEKDSVLNSESFTPFAYSGLGNAEKAIETIQSVLSNDTTNVKNALYQAACLYARLGQKREALRYLSESIEKGNDDFYHIESDYDLDCLRDMPEYRALVERIAPVTQIAIVEASLVKDEIVDASDVVEIPFTKEGGVTKVKCAINGLPLHFVFDTGTADVTMSMVEANFMLKNNYIKPTDIVGAARYMDANGDITEGTIVNLRTVNFGGLELDNVRASVVRNQKAPLLLGQSVLGRLGKIEIDNPGLKLVISHKAKSISGLP